MLGAGTDADADTGQWLALPIDDLIDAAPQSGIILSMFSGGLSVLALPHSDIGLRRAIYERHAEIEDVLGERRPTEEQARAWFSMQSARRTPM